MPTRSSLYDSFSAPELHGVVDHLSARLAQARAALASASAARTPPPPRNRSLAARRCGVYVLTLDDVLPFDDAAFDQRYVPATWRSNKFAAELWLNAAAASHPWRVHSPEAADVLYVAANFSLYCSVGKQFTSRSVWRTLLKKLNGTAAYPAYKLFALTNNECKPPWTGAPRPRDLYSVTDRSARRYGVVAPFVVSRPPWLVGASAAGAPAFVPWADRALLFFPGHVPKLYINSVRYKLWRQVRNLDGVTAISGTLNCTVGAYAVCEGLANRSDAELKTHCAPFCEAMAKDAYRSQAANQPGVKQKAKFAAVAAGSASLLSVRKCPSRSRLHKECRPHRAVNWAAELPDMARAAVKLTQPEYFREAARHRFCLAAPGDFVSTPKITEFVAVGAAGGCLPLLVLDGPPANTLPYTRWLDYCELGFLVNVSTAVRGMAAIVDRLRTVTAAEAAAKHAALARVRDAFVWRAPEPGGRPSAPDHIFAEACDAARRHRAAAAAGVGGAAAEQHVDLRRCMLDVR